MTENEAIKNIKALNAVCWDKDFYDEEFAKAMAKAVKTLTEIQQYRAIGTIEEFKALKEKEERFDRNIKMFNEIGLEVRNNAIDETCLKIFNHLLSEIEWNRVLVDDWDALAEEFKEIAEQMKAGGIDG